MLTARYSFAFAVFVLLSCATISIASPAQTLTTLVNFNFTNGGQPTAPLVQGIDGNFYGTTSDGVHNSGTVFKMTPTGMLVTLYNFCSQGMCTDGSGPGTLIQAADGDFYGTTGTYGGNGAGGTIFKITPAGQLTTVYSFCTRPNCIDGVGPSGLTQGADGNFYGVTLGGGTSGHGTFYKLTPTGLLTTLYNFCSMGDCADGANPNPGLMLESDGSFYGTTNSGGLSTTICNVAVPGCGTIFKITPNGALTTLYSFCLLANCPDGATPSAGLV